MGKDGREQAPDNRATSPAVSMHLAARCLENCRPAQTAQTAQTAAPFFLWALMPADGSKGGFNGKKTAAACATGEVSSHPFPYECNTSLRAWNDHLVHHPILTQRLMAMDMRNFENSAWKLTFRTQPRTLCDADGRHSACKHEDTPRATQCVIFRL